MGGFEEKVYKKYKNGVLHSITDLENNKMTFFYENGNKKLEVFGVAREDKREVRWNEDGSKKSETTFKYSKIVSEIKYS